MKSFMENTRLVFLIIGLVIATVPAFGMTLASSEVTDARLIRAPFLSRGGGARVVGMGEAFTAVADDSSAVSLNPGGIGQISAMSFTATYDR